MLVGRREIIYRRMCSHRSQEINGRRVYLGSCLNDCIQDCNIRALRHLLEDEGADPNVLLPELNYTPFHAVAGSENEDFAEAGARLILNHNGNPNVRADENLTPVHVAASWGHARVLHVLLEGGGSPWLQDELDKNAFDYAKESNDTETINILSEFSQECNVEKQDTFSVMLARMKNLRSQKSENKRKSCWITRNKNEEANSITTRCCTYFDEKEDEEKKQETLDNFNFLDGPTDDSEDSNSSFQNLGSSQSSKYMQIVREASGGSTSGMSSPVPQSSSSESLSQSKSSSLSTTAPAGEQFSNLCSSTLPDLVFSQSSMAITKRKQKTLNFEDKVSKLHSSLSSLQRCAPKDTAEAPDWCSLKLHDSVHVSKEKAFPKASRETQEEGNALQQHISRRSVARTSIMAHRKTPIITVTRPSIHSCELTERRLKEYNSPSSMGLGEQNFTSNRVQQWITSVSNCVPLALVSDDSYHTCESSSNLQDRLNTAAIGSGLNLEEMPSNENTFATVSECYKYADEKNGVVLLEERWLANPVPLSDLTQTDQTSSSAAVLNTDTETIDTENLVKELKSCGIYYGPVTATTKRVYKQQLQKKRTLDPSSKELQSAYSYELQRTLQDRKCMYFMALGAKLEQEVAQQFARTGGRSTWRGGNLKTSFTYLLLDPRITKNLPCRAASLHPKEIWAIFLQSIFYIGKGKRSRPYCHLYEAVTSWKKCNLRYANSKVKCISEIWQEGLGVVCLHVFQNVIPVEAYSREAAMMDAIGVQNLCNIKRGEYYGKAARWNTYNKNVFGVYLLYKSLQIFLSEGERHLSPFDVCDKLAVDMSFKL